MKEMENPNKKTSNFILIIILILFVALCYSFFSKRQGVIISPQNTETTTNNTASTTNAVSLVQSQQTTISELITSWKETQKNFQIKAGESGTYNNPDKLQFIAPETLLVHYDDGLHDNMSLIKKEGNTFVELQNLGAGNYMTKEAWDNLVRTYGDKTYPITSFVSDDNGFKITDTNVFVR